MTNSHHPLVIIGDFKINPQVLVLSKENMNVISALSPLIFLCVNILNLMSLRRFKFEWMT